MKLLVALVALAAAAQVLPKTQVETLDGQKRVIPDAFGGRPAVLVYGFSRKAGDATKAWVDPLVKEGLPVWSVAMLEAAPRFVRPMIRAGMRKDTPAGRQDHALLLYAGEKEWRALLKAGNDEEPVVVLVDGRGRVVWSRAGPASADGLAEVRQRWAAASK